MIPALVLTAGLATRLRPLSLVRAKAALPVAGEPLAHRILHFLAAGGVRDAVLNLHHLPHTITARIGDGSDLGLRVRYSWEVPVLGSAGGPRRASPLLGASTFLVVNGDTLTDVDVTGLVEHHRQNGALVTMAVVPNTQPEKYSGLAVNDRGQMTGFVPRGSSHPSYHFIGVQAVEAEAFARVPEHTCQSVGDLYPALIHDRLGSVVAYRTTAQFFDIGTPADYLDTSLYFSSLDAGSTPPQPTGRVDPSARVERSVLWDDVVVEADAMLHECIVTDGVTVPADTSWRGVSLRLATGDLAPNERRIGELAIASI